jgi:hypothetical protein
MNRIIIALLPLALPAVALAAAPRTFGEFANVLVSIMDSGAGLLILAAVAIYFYGISTSLVKGSDEGREKIRAYATWGLLVIFIMVSIWGIIQLLQNTLFSTDRFSPSTGTPGNTTQFQVPTFSE